VELQLDPEKPRIHKVRQAVWRRTKLTLARLRSIMKIRVGHEDPARSFGNVVGVKGAFHGKIADNHGVLDTHFGKPNAGNS